MHNEVGLVAREGLQKKQVKDVDENASDKISPGNARETTAEKTKPKEDKNTSIHTVPPQPFVKTCQDTSRASKRLRCFAKNPPKFQTR